MGADPTFRQAAEELGAGAAARGIRIVYGGASVGLMGTVADAALAAGGEVHGVIPEEMVDRELAHEGLTNLDRVASMHARKARMVELSDAFVALPGGLGTLDELFEISTWRQLGYHEKPIALVNTAGFFDRLLAYLHHAEEQGFVPRTRAEHWIVSASVEEVLAELS
jgi:uncharacterized protein (TIGR00730 family)